MAPNEGALLRKRPFGRDLLPLVEPFDCGSEEWELEVAEWLKSPDDGAAVATESGDCMVWVYFLAEELVGYASLGLSRGPWNVPCYGRDRIAIVPFFGVASRFQGHPRNVHPLDRYASRIMRDLVAEAMNLEGRGHPLLGLMVDHRNQRAITFYERLGFVSLDADTGGRRYVRMIARLPTRIETE